MKDTTLTNDSKNEAAANLKRVYHTPEIVEHGELTQLTKGSGGTGFDGIAYSSPV